MGNWLITILAVILLLAVLDGVRRAFMKQRAAMKVSRNLSRAMQKDTYREGDEAVLSPARRSAKISAPEKDDDYLDPEEEARRRQIARELPGSVRVVQRRALEEALQVNRQVQETFQSSRKPLAGSEPSRDGAGYREPEQVSLNLEDQVPTLMDSVGGEEDRREPELNESESLEALNGDSIEDADIAVEEAPQTVTAGSVEKPDPAPRAALSREETAPRRQEKRSPVKKQANKPREKSPVEEVLIINVMAPKDDCFEGNDIVRVMMAAGMRFGEMNIYHYHEGGSDDGPVVFSLANMVVPGVFNLAQMEEFTTPGLSLFLALPIDGEAIKAFEQLLATSRQIAELLGGELKDENRSVFTAQTAEHYRQRVMEYQRRKALAMARA